ESCPRSRPPCQPPSNLRTRSRPVNARANRTAMAGASLPVGWKRTASPHGAASTRRSANRMAGSLQAKQVEPAATSAAPASPPPRRRLAHSGPAVPQQARHTAEHIVEVLLAGGVMYLAPLPAHHHHAEVGRQVHHAQAGAGQIALGQVQ